MHHHSLANSTDSVVWEMTWLISLCVVYRSERTRLLLWWPATLSVIAFRCFQAAEEGNLFSFTPEIVFGLVTNCWFISLCSESVSFIFSE